MKNTGRRKVFQGLRLVTAALLAGSLVGLLFSGCRRGPLPEETITLYEHRGDQHYESGDFESALKDYSKALEMGSQKLKVYNNLGNVHYQRGQYEVAEKYYRQALDIDSSYLFALNNLALALYRQRLYQPARVLLSKALVQSPGSAVLYNSLAMVLMGEGDREGAIKSLSKAVEVNPDYSPSLNNLGDLYLKNPELGEDPLPYIKRAIVKDPDNHLFYDALGWYYFQLGVFDEALIHLGKAFVQDPDNIEVRVHYATVLEWLGKEKEALEQWQRIVEMANDPKISSEARRHYWEIKGR